MSQQGHGSNWYIYELARQRNCIRTMMAVLLKCRDEGAESIAISDEISTAITQARSFVSDSPMEDVG